MRNLPLDDREWILENVTVSKRLDKRYAYPMFGYERIEEFVIYTFKFHSLVLLNDYNGYYIVFQDINTKELFKLDKRSWFDIKRSTLIPIFRDNGKIYDTRNYYDQRKIEYKVDIELVKNSEVMCNYDRYKNIKKYDMIKKFCVENRILDSSSILSSESLFYTYAQGNLKYLDIYDMDKFIESFIFDDEYLDECILNERCKLYFDQYYEDLSNELNKHIDKLKIKAILLGRYNKFSGNYKIVFDRYIENKKRDTFDIINIEIGMMGDYQENLKFVKENMRDVKRILKAILEAHPKSSKYANYMKLSSLRVTKDNMLVAMICFKDELEELCSQQ